MILEEYLNYREDLLDYSRDEEGMISESLILSQVLPLMLDAKLIDSEEYTGSYFRSDIDNLKINAYSVNDTGERLHLFVINESSINLGLSKEQLLISNKSDYDTQFKRCSGFIRKAIKGHLHDEIQDSSPVRPLITHLHSSDGIHQFDVIEIFLITATSTVSFRGNTPQPKKIDFENENLEIPYQRSGNQLRKNILIKKRLVDLNFLYDVMISQGNREALVVDFQNLFETTIPAIKAADEEFFESYLCVLPADILSRLYKEYSTRLLEKNVRSFLQFRGVNQGIRDTIRKEPEKFVAYNNGLTITATKGDVESINGLHRIKSLTDFQIVNGGQTTATIYFTQKDGNDISSVRVMAKINIAKNVDEEILDELISNISTYSNAQSRVSTVDLRSRNPQLLKIKSLSESIVTPSGHKWFFERARGEFNTKLRIAGSNKARLKREFPPERKFSKEQMAKYSVAWGDQPYVVKKGGEKVFRFFIEDLCGETKGRKARQIDRTYFEELIAKIILFKSLEKIYGAGPNSMGQLRSAVVPYSISVVYTYSDGKKTANSFNLLKIWRNEGLEEDLESFFTELLKLVNELLKKYSQSEDYGEYSKKKELWDAIIQSREIRDFMSLSSSKQILDKYSVSNLEKSEINSAKDVDFENIADNVIIHSNGVEYYKRVKNLLEGVSGSEIRLLERIILSINKHEDLDKKDIMAERKLFKWIIINRPELLDKIVDIETKNILKETLDYIIREYNNCLNNDKSISSEFNKLSVLNAAKKRKYASVFDKIGRQLEDGNAPNMMDLNYASFSFMDSMSGSNSATITSSERSIDVNVLTVQKAVEWNIKYKILTPKEQQYLAAFAYGLKKINSFHEKNIQKHLDNLAKKGFCI